MSKKIDKLFSNKLNKWESAPGIDAWQQLEDQLLARRRKVWFWRLSIAASIVLIFLVGYVIWNQTSSTVDVQIAEIQKNPISENEISTPDVNEKSTHSTEEKEPIPVNPKNREDDTSVDSNSTAIPERYTADNIYTPVEDRQIPEIEEDGLIDNPELMYDAPIIALEEPKEEVKRKLPPITIEYRSSPSVAVQEEGEDSKKETKGLLRKIQSIAKDVKESDIGLASLREVKDDFLAFDKKREATEEMNN